MDGNKYVLPILAGGGTRLSAHVGILKGLEDLNLSFNHLVGVSGGSILSEDALLRDWAGDGTPAICFVCEVAAVASVTQNLTFQSLTI